MRFLIISSVIHTKSGADIWGYGPYVKEMNLWFKYVNKVVVVAPYVNQTPNAIELKYQHPNITFFRVPALNFTRPLLALKSLICLPYVLMAIFIGMVWASHIHLRCPSNMGLLGSFVQILFPFTPKTMKYAGNWDWNSNQPFSYRLQQRINRSRLLTHRMTALVYGQWPDRNKNILPFFTATYNEKDRAITSKVDLDESINFVFVGTLTENKNPLQAVNIAHYFHQKGFKVKLNLLGDGRLKEKIKQVVNEQQMNEYVTVHGNVDGKTVKQILQQSHFLLFTSRSEGWPKAVAEAMWWGCLPITTSVSCVPYMLGDNTRGALVSGEIGDSIKAIEQYNNNRDLYIEHKYNAETWSQEFTLERFEHEISLLLKK